MSAARERTPRTSPGMCGELACLLEVSARKAGNVHRGRDFADTRYLDFVASAVAIGPVLEHAPERGVGESVLRAITATRSVTARNTNLGIVLLLVPLARVFGSLEERAALEATLAETTREDAAAVYQAIRLANPGGLGEVADEDVRRAPTRTLREVMALAAGRDRIAEQYRGAFADVFDLGVPALAASLGRGDSIEEAVAFCHLTLLAAFPDSLIARKRGEREAAEASARAGEVLAAGWPHGARALRRFAVLDRWLRARGNARNPGTSADLTAASLFLAIRRGIIGFPLFR